MPSYELYVDTALAPRAEIARAGVFLIGGYSGWSNFGDYLQLKTTIDFYRQLACRTALFVLLNAQSPAARERNNAALDAIRKDAIPIYYYCGSGAPDGDPLAPLMRMPRVPPSSLIHVYGGGFINDMWGRAARSAVEALLDLHNNNTIAGQCRIVMSGLQVSPSAEAENWRALFAQAEYIGTRDTESLTFVKALVDGDPGGKVRYSGDDALPALAVNLQRSHKSERPVGTIAVHINVADYSRGEAERRLERIAEVLAVTAHHLGVGLTCDLLISYPGAHVREEEAARELESLYVRMVANSQAPTLTFRLRNIFEEIVADTFQFAPSLLVTCSYHVALAGLLSNCPTLLLVENDHYRQKAAGLKEAFRTSKFVSLGERDDVAPAVKSLTEQDVRAMPMSGSHGMWTAQLDKALRVASVYIDMERVDADDRLEATAGAFREVAENLGELRKRLILEERIASSMVVPVAQHPKRSKSLSRYWSKSYWTARRAKLFRSVKKRLDQLASMSASGAD